MKKQIMLLLVAIAMGFGIVNAQAPARLSPEERTKIAMEKIKELKLSEDVAAKTQLALTDFYNAQQKSMEAMRAEGKMDKDAMMAKRKELADARDVKLKALFTAEQFKKWQDEIEPSLRPQRPQKQ